MASWGQIIHLFTKLKELTERCEEYWSHVAMVRRRMMLRPVVGIVRGAGVPINRNCSWLMLQSRSQWKRISMALVRFGYTCLLMMPSAVELST